MNKPYTSIISKFDFKPLLVSETPVQPLDNLSKKWGHQLLIKRDDLTGLAAGGNKSRKLEFLLADALKMGCDTIVTGGGRQSNHASQSAIAAKMLGLNCQLALVDPVPIETKRYQQNGNLILNSLAGAIITHFNNDKTSAEGINSLFKKVKDEGKLKPYLVPMGGSNALGSLGYVKAAFELIKQLEEQQLNVDSIFVASGSAGTQAGIIVGLYLAKSKIKVHGISVLNDQNKQIALVTQLCSEIAELLSLEPINWLSYIDIDDTYLGEGYGLPSDTTWSAIELLIQSEGIICDPVYTGKALDGWFDYLDKKIKKQRSLFWHTGGLPGLFAYN